MTKTSRGFTLIEMAIVLVIITILIGGLAVPLSAQIQARRIAETKKTLDEAREAIVGYAMGHTVASTCNCSYPAGSGPLIADATTTCPVSHCPATGTGTLTLPIARHYLPCPDLNGADPEPNLDNDGVNGLTDLNNGAEDRIVATQACATASGNLPWVTLGAAAQDAWGNRLRYQVTLSFADRPQGAPLAGGIVSIGAGDIQVCSTAGCAVVDVAANVPAVLLSYGANGWGARNINGNVLKNPTSANELENINADVNYASRLPSKAGDAAGEFDDLVTWVSADQLRGRLCPAGGCP